MLGPQLIGIQPNNNSLFNVDSPFDAVVPNTMDVAPKELTLHFDATSAIDPTTLSAIRITRTGFDDRFSVATVASDFNTPLSAAIVDFSALNLGVGGNEISLLVTKSDHSLSGKPAGPVIGVVGKTINVDLNTQAGFQTTAQQLVDAINGNSAAKLLVKAQLRNGVGGAVDIATPAVIPPLGLPLNLANAGVEIGRAHV